MKYGFNLRRKKLTREKYKKVTSTVFIRSMKNINGKSW